MPYYLQVIKEYDMMRFVGKSDKLLYIRVK